MYEITHVTIADQGYYICQGTNDAGAAEERVSLVVNTVPERGDITGKKINNNIFINKTTI